MDFYLFLLVASVGAYLVLAVRQLDRRQARIEQQLRTLSRHLGLIEQGSAAAVERSALIKSSRAATNSSRIPA